MKKNGRIWAVSIGKYRGIQKFQGRVVVSRTGFVDDAHINIPGRHISIVAHEVLEEMNQKLGISLVAGSLGENVTTIGLGDLSDLDPGSMIRIGGKVILQVSGQNAPCKKINIYHKLLAKTIYGKRGVVCEVNGGAGEILKPGDTIEVIGGSVAL